MNLMKFYEILRNLKKNIENLRKGKDFNAILQNIKKSYEKPKEI